MISKFRAVLWDFGGVITTSPFEAFNRYELINGIPLDFIRGVNAVNATANAWARFESSAVTLDEFDALFASETRAAGFEIRGRTVVDMLSGEVRPRMVAALKECKRHYRVACLTNNVKAGHGAGMASSSARAANVQEVMNLFDVVIESSKEGIRKPDPRIYLLACERMKVKPQEVLFLDDLGINLKPARELGMMTIKVVSEQQAIDDLQGLLDIQLD